MLKIYKCGELYESHEKEQLQVLIDKLYSKFDQMDYDVYLVIDPKLGGDSRQIDCLFYRKNKIAIIELKNIRGEFFPNANESEHWEGLDEEGKRIPIGNERINPFRQVRSQRKYLSAFIEGNFDHSNGGIADESTHKKVMRLISGFIVTAENSTPGIYDETHLSWCTVLPISEELMVKLSHVETGENYGISETDFSSILKIINAEETDRSSWSYGTKVPEQMLSRLPEVEGMLKSDKLP